MARCILIDDDGNIANQISGDPTMFAQQTTDDLSVFALDGAEDCGEIDANNRYVNGDGELAAKPGQTPRDSVGDVTLYYIPE